jgi:pimeloyl-ACP methyl ester carboxylesterase
LNTVFRYLLFAFGILFSLPFLAIVSLLPGIPVTFLGMIYLLSYFLIICGMLFAPLGLSRSFTLILTGGILAFTTGLFRIILPASGSHVNMMTLPSRSGPRLLNRILNERDAVLFGAQIGPYFGVITQAEKQSLLPAFSQAYKDMNAYGATPLSPFLTTYLNQQRSDEFDVVIAEPELEIPPKSAIIFLHGYGGNFTIQCWLIAKPGFRINALTVCPSTGVNGQWWSPQGQAILQETLTYVHQRGIERIYLAGLSNGAISASRLADQFKDELAGLILISGADPDAIITELPSLVIQGQEDERIPVSMIEQYVSVAQPHAMYHLFEGDHFLLLKQADQVQPVIADWLIQQEATGSQ